MYPFHSCRGLSRYQYAQNQSNDSSRSRSRSRSPNVKNILEQNFNQSTEETSTRVQNISINRDQSKTKTVRGTTSIFIVTSGSTCASFKKLEITSEKISISKYPNLAAIQTLQFQKPSWRLRGHTCMVDQGGIWKLFFIHHSSIMHHVQMYGYMYNADVVSSKDLIPISVSGVDKKFYWVNLLEKTFPANSLPELKYPVLIANGNYYGNHTPSHIKLPKFDTEYHQNLAMKQEQIDVEKFKGEQEKETKNINNNNNVYSKTPWNGMKSLQSLYKPTQRGNKRKTISIFRTKKNDGIRYLTIFQPASYDILYNKFLDSSILYISVPYYNCGNNIDNHPFRIVNYALIHYSNVNALQQLKEEEYNKTLDRLGVLKFPLYQPTIDQPTRFCIVGKEEFDEMVANPKLYSWDAIQTIDNDEKTLL